MKVGILTFHFAHNYGAMLQAYATSIYLRKLGFNAEIIDYRLPFIYRYNHEMFGFWGLFQRYRENNGIILSVIKTIFKYWSHRHPGKKWFRFEDFLNNTMIKSDRIYDINIINRMGYDAIVCGSDQIWNARLTGGLIPEYFGYGLSKDIIKIAYAGSNGATIVDLDLFPLFKKYISSFRAVSIREKGLSDFLNSHGIFNIQVLDPIFLLDKEEWHSIAIKPKEKEYVLTYSFNEPDFFFEMAQNVARTIGKKLVCFLFDYNKKLPSSVIQITDGGPREFLGYIENADFIISNSFHGTAFSILFERQFICVPPTTGRERIDSLLSLLTLSYRICTTLHYPNNIIDSLIDYQSVNSIIESQKKISQNFFIENLKK